MKCLKQDDVSRILSYNQSTSVRIFARSAFLPPKAWQMFALTKQLGSLPALPVRLEQSTFPTAKNLLLA